MAIARCERCGYRQRTKQRYTHSHAPMTSMSFVPRILCGALKCTNLASIWLSDEEEAQYRRGVRNFRVMRHQQVQVA
jgi:hypothetical protein